MNFLSIFLIDTTTLTLGVVISVLISSLILGLILAGTYVWTHYKQGYDRSFCVTLMLFPMIASIIILLVSNDIARAFSLAGVFTLIRFRTTMTDTRDIMYVFATVAIGLTVGLGYTGYALAVISLLIFVMAIIHILKFDQEKETKALLKIIVPENLNFQHAFDAIFDKYLETFKLTRVKTMDFGTTYELSYHISIKKGVNQKVLLDALRTKNGNMNITLTSEYVSRVTE